MNELLGGGVKDQIVSIDIKRAGFTLLKYTHELADLHTGFHALAINSTLGMQILLNGKRAIN